MSPLVSSVGGLLLHSLVFPGLFHEARSIRALLWRCLVRKRKPPPTPGLRGVRVVDMASNEFNQGDGCERPRAKRLMESPRSPLDDVFLGSRG